MDRKCCPNEGLSVEVNKTVWMGLGSGAWRDTLSQDFCRASNGKILGKEGAVKGYSHFSFLLFPFKHSPVTDIRFPVHTFSAIVSLLLPFSEPYRDTESLTTLFYLRKRTKV